MPQIFLSDDACRRDAWARAFPDMLVGRPSAIPAGEGTVWALVPAGQAIGPFVGQLRLALGQRVLIVLADEPTEDQALQALAAGAVGYCNGHAAPEVLRNVAKVVESGGIWVGQGLMQRLLSATSRVFSRERNLDGAWRSKLTAREQEAAQLLAKGLSNKEIARKLDIAERTVKSHVSAMLEKLGARDRLQLSLIINGIDENS